MSIMDDMIRGQLNNGHRHNADSDYWINRPYSYQSEDERKAEEAKQEEERIKKRVESGFFQNWDAGGRMTPEYQYYLKEKAKREREGLKGVIFEKDMTDEEREERFRNNPLARAYRYQKDRHDRIVGWNHGNEEGQRKLFEKREKPDIDEMIRKQGKIGHGSYELTRKFHKNVFGKRDDKSGNPTKGMTDREKDTYKWRMEYKDRWGYDPLADKETQERQKKAYEARKRSAEG